MTKIQRINQFQRQFSFSNQEEQFELFYSRFLEGDLGKIYQAIPWDSLVKEFQIKDSIKGPTSTFSPRGKIALMFLKHFGCCSDKRLLEQLNGNIEYQFFCDVYLGSKRLTNHKIISEIRCELASKLSIAEFQKILYAYWSDYIEDNRSITVDATCYESEVRYPTNQKLLWEAIQWNYKQLAAICKVLKQPLPRTKYRKWKARYTEYSKMRKKSVKKRIRLTRSLLWLLEKLNKELDLIDRNNLVEMPKAYYRRRGIINKVLAQQNSIFYTGKLPSDRIVSLGKDYLRPIIRGKEIKLVEFGAKVNKFQIDGINFIEHLDFNAFHEGIRFKQTVFTAQKLISKKLSIVGADGIYATNVNRKFCTKYNIRTDFRRKGKASKHEPQRKQLACLITKERASRLEGSFGKEKEHYHLKKIKAKTETTEKLWILFGIHTANALEIGRRIVAKKLHQVA